MQHMLQTLLPSLNISPGMNVVSFPPEIMTYFGMEIMCLSPSCVILPGEPVQAYKMRLFDEWCLKF